MVGRILVPLDGSPLAAAAVPYAATLARALDAPIGLLAVVESFPDRPGVPSDDAIAGDDRRVAASAAHLDAVAATLRATDLVIGTALRHGNPASAILAPASEILAEAEGAEGVLLVMSTHGRTGLERLRRGSVAPQVLRHSGTPTLVIPPCQGASTEGRSAISEVTITLDGSPLAEEALPLATQLAAALAVPLTLLQVISSLPAPEGWGTGYGGCYPITPDLEREEGHAIADDLEAVAVPLRAPDRTVLTCWRRSTTAQAGECIATYLAERPMGLAVTASHGRGGVLRWALGSTAEYVLDRAPCPILIVRAGSS